MAKSTIEKQLEKLQKEAKKQSEKQLAIVKKKEREDKRNAEKEALRLRAASIVSNQPNIDGIPIMDKTAENVLGILIGLCANRETGRVNYKWENFPQAIQHSLPLELEKLVQYGMITSVNAWMGGGMLNILPSAFTYFEDKEIALQKQEERKMSIHIEKLENSGTFIAGNAINSTFSVDNSVKNIEKKIDESGGGDKEALIEILEEVKELIENIETSRSIPKQKGLLKKISEHATTHGWFYGEIIALLGQAALQMIGGQ